MGALQRDGVRLGYEAHGSGEPTLVFVHGWCCDRSHFAPQMERFAAEHRVVALDQRGFGESDRPEQAYTIEGFADDIAFLCTSLGLEKPVVIGHSLGGAVALAVAARHPELPSGLVLCDPAAFWPEPLLPGMAELAEAFATPQYKEHARDFVRRALFIDGDDPALRERIVTQMSETPQHVMHSSFANLHAFDEAEAARACRVPVLSIDAATPIVDRDRFRAACPHVTFDATPGAGHFHQLLVPDEINAKIERFVAGLAGPGSRL